MKKAIIIVLMVCLVLGAAFADGLKVGVRGGYGSESIGYVKKGDSQNYLRIFRNGFYGAASLEFDASEALGLKADFGMLLSQKAFLSVRNGSADEPSWDEIPDYEPAPVLKGYLGLVFNADLTKSFGLGFGAGLDVAFGRMDKDDEDTFNIAIGAGAEISASAYITESLALTVGGRFSYYFYNSNKEISDSAEALGCNVGGFGWQGSAGLTVVL